MLPFLLLLIECLDELVFGAREAAWPAIRSDLNLTYEQIGLLLSLPAILGNAIEPALGILADTGRRKLLIIGGGIVFALSLLLLVVGQSFGTLLIAFVILYPASGAFVSLSQATLMDLHPMRHEQMMARWSFSGAVGVVGGSLVVSAALTFDWGWRVLFLAFALLTLPLVASVWSQHGLRAPTQAAHANFGAGLVAAWRALHDGRIVRWLVLLNLADLMLDIFLGFIALYFVDIVNLSASEAALAVTLWTVASFIGHALVIPLLERVRGLAYLRWSALGTLILYAILLLTPNLYVKFFVLALLGLGSAGWYSVLQGQLYSAMPNQSGTSVALASIASVIGGVLPLMLGIVAERLGLWWAMALLAVGPLSLLVGLPGGGMKVES